MPSIASPSRPVTTGLQGRKRENGFIEYTIKGQKFELPERYTPDKKLGSGSYGLVIAAKDSVTGDRVAIKRCGDVFKHTEDGKRVLREIKMMQMLSHRNVLMVRDMFVTDENFNDVYIVTTCMDADLTHLIKNYKLTQKHIEYIMFQVLRGVKYVHSAGILHRDMKPANILVGLSDCHLKLCDFGLARGYIEGQDMTSYIVTRWYRAPELLLNNTQYNGAIDVWAAGCIFAEMLIGKTLFCGESSIEQIKLICETIPISDPQDLSWVQSPKQRAYLASLAVEGTNPNKTLEALLASSKKESARDPVALDMLKSMLAFNPAERLTPTQLLDHPWLAGVKTARHMEPSQYKFKWRWDARTGLTNDQLRQLFWAELAKNHPEVVPENTAPASPVAAKVAQDAGAPPEERAISSTASTPVPV